MTIEASGSGGLNATWHVERGKCEAGREWNENKWSERVICQKQTKKDASYLFSGGADYSLWLTMWVAFWNHPNFDYQLLPTSSMRSKTFVLTESSVWFMFENFTFGYLSHDCGSFRKARSRSSFILIFAFFRFLLRGCILTWVSEWVSHWIGLHEKV